MKGQRVDVYKNLHHGGFSIRDSKTNLVLAHADSVLLDGGIEFKVNEKGQLKTVTEKRKRVHAFVRGCFVSANESKAEDMSQILIYDPYVTPLFKDVASGQYVHDLEGEVFFEGTVMYTRVSAAITLEGSLF
ncbi:hypothetical protein [Peribacillus asahii]|uniref:hypothetical protein n=1 Tax=Peribacillus asahii TaxID=228899 RepID=UPI00207988C6|nr:hypothetical protein [Peribacillus asahii]USK62172.1 hypothetical protein LIT37_23635 [Peribacillus asahii]